MPKEKEDKNTADEEDSPRQLMGSQDGGNQLFDDEAGTSHHAEVAANIDNSSSFLTNFDQKEEKKVER